MDDILYLVHASDDPNFNDWKEVKVSLKNSFITHENNQFPGVYFTLITKQNIDNVSIYPGKYLLFFSKDLLLQSNYHLNLYDHNGMVSEHNTYYPWNLDEFLEEQNKIIKQNRILGDDNYKIDSEVVFHDNISIEYLCKYIERPNTPIDKNDSIEIIIEKINKVYTLLPREPLTCGTHTMQNEHPFYCYPFENTYPIEDKVKPSSIEWLKMVAKSCDVTIHKNDNIDSIREKIKMQSKNIYENREKQKVEILKHHKKKLNGGKRTTKKKRSTNKKRIKSGKSSSK
jgi:hypothetical protein